jgi:hypothetical protein
MQANWNKLLAVLLSLLASGVWVHALVRALAAIIACSVVVLILGVRATPG